MINTILGIKNETDQVFVEGLRIPVTRVTAGPCVVTQVKNMEKDGYWSIQIGFGTKRAKNTSKPLQGHLKNSNTLPRYIREIRLDSQPEFKVGDTINITEMFKAGDVVEVTGTSKGKGFAGGVKRYHFRGGPRTHGQSDRERAPGSIGQTTTPGRVYRGKRMAGRMGSDTKTIKNLHVIEANPETNSLIISGLIPGTRGSFITVTKTREGSLKDLETQIDVQVAEG